MPTIGITGPEGAGKSLVMTYFSLRHLARGGKVLTFPGYEVTDGHKNPLSQLLPMEEWVTLPPELRDVLIDIDEIQNYFGSDRYMSWINKLFANIAGQRRHRNIGIIYTLQDWGELDPRVRRKTGILITCSDVYWSPWGKEQGLGRGEFIDYFMWDVQGFFTGRPWTPMGGWNLRAKEVWNHYDSYSDVDIFSGMTQVEFKKPKITIDLRAPEEEKEAAPVVPGHKVQDSDMAMLNELVNTPGINLTTVRQLAQRLRKQ